MSKTAHSWNCDDRLPHCSPEAIFWSRFLIEHLLQQPRGWPGPDDAQFSLTKLMCLLPAEREVPCARFSRVQVVDCAVEESLWKKAGGMLHRIYLV